MSVVSTNALADVFTDTSMGSDSLPLPIYLYKFVNFLPSTLNLRMIEQQSKCCLLLPVILTAKNVSRKRKSQHMFLGLAWAIDEI